jgi:hypothetical protein
MVGGYPNRTFQVADKFALKEGIPVKVGDILVRTGVTKSNGYPEITKWDASLYEQNDIVGVSHTDKDADTIARAPKATVNVKGADQVKVTEDVKQGDKLVGAGKQFTELFDGDGTALQQISIALPPVSSVVSVTEDPSGSPTVLTQVSINEEPGADEYNIDLTKGLITIGGTSVSGTDNYEVVYNIDEGRARKWVYTDEQTIETGIVVTTDVGNISETPEEVLQVESTTGTTTGIFTIIYAGTPATTQVKVEGGKLTFAAADAVTEATAVYKNGVKGFAEAMEDKSAGEQCVVYVDTL